MDSQARSRPQGFAARHPRVFGVLILIALHAVFAVLPAAEWLGLKREASILLIGVVQLAYAIPAILLSLKLRHPEVAKGLVIGAVITFLANMAGCAAMFAMLSRIG
ncbi:MAG: hypothetical protein IT513_09750 [Burkholderiales bacterium]|nr:hypothetical protein [Burkholderiales bacterium]